ncbi:TonB-dependent receptor domain-containing protein [Sphingobium sp. EM0848]|uniref:TonB-dependent receptor domain-containing protein n=1 Tax=Sphingobium sp. EM0848 TaxID=2743473 RepID=UPI00159CB4CB|nr:TonB-dependent receptor [Sphingobium sp. EM0848]
MVRHALALALAATLIAGHDPAAAQMLLQHEGTPFSLKPRSGLPGLHTGFVPARTTRARIDRLDIIPVDDRADMVEIMLRRQKLAFTGSDDRSPTFAPRSRMVLLTVQDRLSIRDNLSAVLGFQGMKLINNGANVTAVGRDGRLRVRDWFLPRAAIAFTPRDDLALAFSYREIARGFGETGRSGPMGLAHEDFRALARRLQPERHSRLRLDADWQATPELSLAMTAYHGQISDRLSFLDRSALPLNGGSATIEGVRIGFRHRLSPHWYWAMRYGEARLNSAADHGSSEHSLTLETGWTHGPLKATMRGTSSSLPAFASDARSFGRRFRVEADIRYQRPSAPLALSLRLTDPDRLASSALASDAPSGPVLAADRARGLVLGVKLNW